MGLNRMLTTVFLIFVWITMGLYLLISGPAMIDLTILFDASYEDISRSLAGGGIGGIIGACLQLPILDKFENWLYLIISAALLLDTLVVVLIPFVINLTALWCFSFLLSFTITLCNAAGQRIIILIWKEKAPAPLHAIHAGFGLGGVFIPLLVNPFLATLQYDTPLNTTGNCTELLNKEEVHQPKACDTGKPTEQFRKFTVVEDSRIQYGYLIVAAITLLLSLAFALFQYIESKSRSTVKHRTEGTISKPSRNFKAILNPVTYTGGSLLYSLSVFLIVAMFYINVVGGENMFGTFVRSFSVDQLRFSKNDASFLNMVYWLGFASGRFIGSIISHFVNMKLLLLVEACLCLGSIIALDILSASNATMLWVFTAVQGVLIGPLFPSGIAFLNTIMDVSIAVVSFINIVLFVGYFLYIWVAGIMYDKHGPRVILHVFLVSGIFILLSVIAFLAISYKYRRISRNNRKRAVEESGDIEITESLNKT